MTQLQAGITGELALAASEYSAADRTKWLEARRSGLGASETATILGLNEWQTPLSVWQEKMDTTTPEEKDIGPKARWGQVLEDVIARQVSKEFLAKRGEKIAPSPGLLRHKDHKWLLATVDRLIVPRGRDAENVALGVLEIKTTGYWNYKHHWLDGFPPAHIQLQVQQQLAVSGLPYALVACLVDGYDLKEPVLIERDEQVIEQIITYAGTWWQEYVEAEVMPEATFADRSILSEIYPGDESLPAIGADEEIEKLLGDYDFHRTKEKEHKEAKEVAQFELQKLMEDALAIVDEAGNVRATWKPSTTRRVDTTALRKAKPEVADEFTKVSTSRRFLVKEIQV